MELNDLVFLDEQFDEAEEPKFTDVPPGEYVARVDSIDLIKQEVGGEDVWVLKQELLICEGEQDGQRLFRRNQMATPQNLGWLKADLRKYGIDLDAPGFRLSEFLTNNLNSLLDRVMKVKVRTSKGKPNPDGTEGKQFTNVDLLELMETPELDSAGAVAGDALDPFANE